jgi:hypothetical protein
MDIDDQEEHGCTVHMDIPEHPSVIDITHYAFHAIESHIYVGGIIKG